MTFLPDNRVSFFEITNFCFLNQTSNLLLSDLPQNQIEEISSSRDWLVLSVRIRPTPREKISIREGRVRERHRAGAEKERRRDSAG